MKLFRCSESEPTELSTLEHIRIVNVDAMRDDSTSWINELINELDQLAVGETSTRKHGPVDFTRVR